MKNKITIVILVLIVVSCGQSKNNEKHKNPNQINSLTLSAFNYAEKIFSGILYYEFTEDTLKIIRKPGIQLADDNDTSFVELIKPINNSSIERIQNLHIDTLEDYYGNYCIMTTSGNSYSIFIDGDSINKKIYLHHFYLKQIEELIKILNKEIPESLKIEYLPSDTKQDCE